MRKFSMLLLIFLISISFVQINFCQQNKSTLVVDSVAALKSRLIELASLSNNIYFINHCQSFLSVINAKTTLSQADSSLLKRCYTAFADTISAGNPAAFNSYINRQRSMILSWTSPTDSATSFSWLKLPKDWDPNLEYPLYIELHGLWSVAGNSIEYLTYPYLRDATDNFAFEDGYQLNPWGRGNLWYKGISETDIWECIDAFEEIVSIDTTRRYLCGHSMGGFGAWYIGLRSVNTWAALGIHAGALGYDNSVLTAQSYQTLKDMPVYFVVGTSDGLYNVDHTAYIGLQNAGNTNIEFVTFNGGHEYLVENVENMYLWMKDFTKDYTITSIGENTLPEITDGSMYCYPNPLQNEGTIRYTIPVSCEVSVDVYDMYGRLIKNIDKGYKHPGNFEISIEATHMVAGIYFCRLQMNQQSHSIKIVVGK